MEIYKPTEVQELEDFYGDLLTKIDHYQRVSDHLEALSARMWEGVQAKIEGVFTEIKNYHWRHLGKSTAALVKLGLARDDCRQAIANEYGFRRWTEVEHMTSPYNTMFETAVNAMLDGELAQVKKLLAKKRDLVKQKSRYGHEATLLHYAVSNGVELWRQKVPENLPVTVAFLMEHGANPNAKMKVYGGEYTPSELLPSSAHPRAAGILPELRKLFKV
ncbi:MAG TPA: hypothetical protein VKN36_04125 [Eudoraea sp.]|nr:hypothetical protein [Eudoraea sp.]